MDRAGFVLVGGRSSRMGRNKALLPYRGTTLVEHVAAAVGQAAGSVSLVGSADEYSSLGLPVIPDLLPGAGPLAGIQAALAHTASAWNLIVACDMPGLEAGFLGVLLEAAEASGGDCLIPIGPSGFLEPLCAVYHRRCLEAIGRALGDNIRKVTRGLAHLDVQTLLVPEPLWLENINTPSEWAQHDRE